MMFCRPFRGLYGLDFVYPWLTPWARLYRPSGARPVKFNRQSSPGLWNGFTTNAAMSPAFGVEVAALPAAVVHFPGKELGYSGAQAKYPHEQRQAKQRVFHSKTLFQTLIPGPPLR